MEEDIKNKEWKEALLKYTSLDDAFLRYKLNMQYPNLTLDITKRLRSKYFKKRK